MAEANREKFYCEQYFVWQKNACQANADKLAIPATESDAKAADRMEEYQCWKGAKDTEKFCLAEKDWVTAWYKSSAGEKTALRAKKSFGPQKIEAICNRMYMVGKDLCDS